MNYEHLIRIKRDSFSTQTTLGKLDIDGEHFCETLEDTVRPVGIKVYGETAIPSDIYMSVGIHYSNKFKREVLILSTEEDGVTIKHEGVEFGYVYLHGGNKHNNTLGCPLVAHNRVDRNTIQSTAEAELFDVIAPLIRAGKNVQFIARNGRQTK